MLGDLKHGGSFELVFHSAAEPDRAVDWLGEGDGAGKQAGRADPKPAEGGAAR